MPKFLIIPILAVPILWACACASTDSCAEEWYNESEEVDSKNKATCVDQAKYDDCVDYYQCISTAPDFSISDYCRDLAKKRCNDK